MLDVGQFLSQVNVS